MDYMRVFIFASFSALCACVIMLYTDYLFPSDDSYASESACPFYDQKNCGIFDVE
jgi:hypothetical protein